MAADESARALVTGAAGFIGSHLVERLVEEGREVVAVDNLSTGYMRNVDPFLEEIEFIQGDIRDPELCEEVCDGVDEVYHQAALGSVPRSVKRPLDTHGANATGTLNMLVAARDAEVDAFVFAASSSVYGNTEELPKVETMKRRPLSPYATSKAAGEYYLENFADIHGLPTVGLRYFNVFGPRQDPEGPYAAVIPKFVGLLVDGERPTIHWDGEQTRDFTFVDNVVEANLSAAQNASEAAGEVMNVGCGERISIDRLYDIITDELGVDVEPEYGEKREGDVRDSLADISKARALIGYEPEIDVREGLAETVHWFAEEW